MQVTSATNTTNANNTAASSTTAVSGAPTLDYNAFLTLLIAELKNQDPTKPMDSAQYMSQLASFSNVEQTIKMSAKLDALISGQTLAQAESVIGKTITSSDGLVSGKVISVTLLDSGAVAELENGSKVNIEAGIKVAN